jgi:hypothetical protein
MFVPEVEQTFFDDLAIVTDIFDLEGTSTRELSHGFSCLFE